MVKPIIITPGIFLGVLFSQTFSESTPVHTYSIVAFDEETGELGVAVQSHWFSVGFLVPWAKAGVGAVATQSFVKVDYGPEGLNRMEHGQSAEEALTSLLEEDEGEAVRQVAMIDVKGSVAAHTGTKCIYAAGHQIGINYSVQANLMEKETVWPSMANAFERSNGDLAEKMMAALEAAEAEGGDIRGKQSGLLSRAMTAPDNKIRIPLNEEGRGNSAGQIEEYLLQYNGEGIQHIAFATEDLIETLDKLIASGVTLMTPPPDDYYDKLEERLP